MKDQAARDDKTLVIATTLLPVSLAGLVVVMAFSAAGPVAGFVLLAALLVLRTLVLRRSSAS
ncbi:hypothetical protein [Nocardioides rubriscoriae]|uniref:hypothetical protein n=1 Tax=Nocardioides rubriscoriae TaxID=642762 RepID=UPI0011DF377A|nr:hypothetical protein [Nocardioides rubriscoriae]